MSEQISPSKEPNYDGITNGTDAAFRALLAAGVGLATFEAGNMAYRGVTSVSNAIHSVPRFVASKGLEKRARRESDTLVVDVIPTVLSSEIKNTHEAPLYPAHKDTIIDDKIVIPLDLASIKDYFSTLRIEVPTGTRINGKYYNGTPDILGQESIPLGYEAGLGLTALLLAVIAYNRTRFIGREVGEGVSAAYKDISNLVNRIISRH